MLSRGFPLLLLALIFIAGIHSTVTAKAETPICGSSASSSLSLSLSCRFIAEEVRLDHLPILLLTGSGNSSQTSQVNEDHYDTSDSNDKNDNDNNIDNKDNNNGNIEREIPSVVSAIPFP